MSRPYKVKNMFQVSNKLIERFILLKFFIIFYSRFLQSYNFVTVKNEDFLNWISSMGNLILNMFCDCIYTFSWKTDFQRYVGIKNKIWARINPRIKNL